MKTANGNGKRNYLALADMPAQLPEAQTHQAMIREACFNGITEEDAKQIVQAIVAKAKEGDTNAQKMFFDYLAGGKDPGPKNVTVNVVADVETAARLALRESGRGQ